jgi:hypothetical protein
MGENNLLFFGFYNYYAKKQAICSQESNLPNGIKSKGEDI